MNLSEHKCHQLFLGVPWRPVGQTLPRGHFTLGVTSPGKPPERSTGMCFLELRSLCPFLMLRCISDECRTGRYTTGLRCLPASGSGSRRPERPYDSCRALPLCVRGKDCVSEHPWVHKESTRPAQMWTPDRTLPFLCVTPGTNPPGPARFISAAWDRLLARAPICQVTLACDSGLCSQKHQSH